jgi:hypothetical protein
MYILLILMSTILFSFDNDQEKDIQKLSSEQKVTKANSMISKMEGSLKEAYIILKKTRKEKDVIKLNCVNDSIRKISGLLKRSKDDSINLQESIAKDDPKSINYYYTKISLANENIKQASIEALSCSGTITIESNPVVDISIEELVVENNYLDDDYEVYKQESNVDLTPLSASPYF